MSDRTVVARDLVKTYENGRTRALDGVSLEIFSGEFVAICGPSGSGKSTLLNLIGALDRPDSGELWVAGEDLTRSHGDFAGFRARKVGFIFQLHNLIPSLTALENVLIPTLELNRRDAHARARELLERVGLADKAHRRPPELSGGERQRVAVARALVNNPELILADEPTGSLDSKTEQAVLELLRGLQSERGVTLILVTHDPRVAQSADRVIELVDGLVTAPVAF
ncbi:MAG: ABC transporter ATP-binding protein [Candidatus Bipolaricaulota bacterium]|nr:ABC transporter ATP-binding protein [Candidatus Bipolaricaulota bacterium]